MSTPRRSPSSPQADSLGLLLRDLDRYPMPDYDEQVALAKRVATGDDEAKKQMVAANLRLVLHWARRYQDRGVELVDLVQEGTFGLLRAVEKFDWERGFKFSTYATWWIRQSLQRAVQQHGRTIRIPLEVGEHLQRVDAANAELIGLLGRRQVQFVGLLGQTVHLALHRGRQLLGGYAGRLQAEGLVDLGVGSRLGVGEGFPLFFHLLVENELLSLGGLEDLLRLFLLFIRQVERAHAEAHAVAEAVALSGAATAPSGTGAGTRAIAGGRAWTLGDESGGYDDDESCDEQEPGCVLHG